MNSVVLGNPFFRKHSIEINPGENILKLPELTFELKEIKTPREGSKTIPKRRYAVVMSQEVIVRPQHQQFLQTKVDFRNNLEARTDMIIPDEDLENSTELPFLSIVVTVGKVNTVSILAINLKDHAKTFTKNKQVAVFQFLSPQDEEELIEVGPEFLALNE